MLQRHVNGHFSESPSGASTQSGGPRKSIEGAPARKVLKRAGVRLKFRKLPFSARIFDFFDAGMMAGILGHPADEIPRADMWWWLMMPIAAVLGHMFSPFVGFKGGKGVATGSGAMLAIWPVLTGPLLVAIGLWAIMIALTRTMSIASMLAAVSIPLTVAAAAILTTGTGTTDGELPVAHALPAIIVTAGVAALVVWKHRSNLERILKGTEPRVGSKS